VEQWFTKNFLTAIVSITKENKCIVVVAGKNARQSKQKMLFVHSHCTEMIASGHKSAVSIQVTILFAQFANRKLFHVNYATKIQPLGFDLLETRKM